MQTAHGGREVRSYTANPRKLRFGVVAAKTATGCVICDWCTSRPLSVLVTVTQWHLLLFVTAHFVSSSFRGRRHAFMSMSHTLTVKRSSGLHHRWLWPTILVFLLRNFDKRKPL